MCEDCGCQANRSVEDLTHEHDAALDDVRAGRRAVAGGDRQGAALAAARLLELLGLDVLREHIAQEQDGLFPAALISLSSSDREAVEQVRARVGTALRPVAVVGR